MVPAIILFWNDAPAFVRTGAKAMGPQLETNDTIEVFCFQNGTSMTLFFVFWTRIHGGDLKYTFPICVSQHVIS